MSDEWVVTMPKLGETVTEGEITNWFKAAGDEVAFDDPLFEVSTDKVDSEIPSPYDGVVLEVLVASGETVPVGTPVVRIGPPGSVASNGGTTRGAPEPAPLTGAPAASTSVGGGPTASPAAAIGGRASTPVGGPGNGSGRGPMLSPLVRRLAAEKGIDLATVPGSGAGGRIRREDVEKAASTGAGGHVAPAPVETAAAAPAARPQAPRQPVDARPEGRTVVEPLSRMRLAIADRMTHSVRVAPHVWTSVEVDLETVELVRTRHKARFRKEEGQSLTYLGFVARAVCDGLRAFPSINSSVDLDARTRTTHGYVNLGIAVDLDEQGLVAPVIRDADALNLRGLARAIRVAAGKATSGQFTVDDLTGSTFTITNPGPIGDYASAPIINQPNSAILSTNMVSRRPTVVGDGIAIHHMTILGFSYDHRAFDGVTASRFLAFVRDALENRDWEAELG